MKADEVFTTAKDALTVRRVYADPVERDGITVITAATIGGGAGGGSGQDKDGGEGSGGAFGVGAKPAGAYVIKNGEVRWQPAVDVNRLMVVVGAIAITALVVGARLARRVD